MKTRATISVALLVTAFGCRTGAEEAAAPAELTEADRLALTDTLLEAHGRLVAAAEAVDADGVLAMFDADARVIIDGEVLAFDVLAERVRRTYDQLDHQDLSWHPAEVTVLSPNAVAMTIGGRAVVVGSEGDTLMNAPVAWTEVFVRRDGAWKIVQAHQSSP